MPLNWSVFYKFIQIVIGFSHSFLLFWFMIPTIFHDSQQCRNWRKLFLYIFAHQEINPSLVLLIESLFWVWREMLGLQLYFCVFRRRGRNVFEAFRSAWNARDVNCSFCFFFFIQSCLHQLLLSFCPVVVCEEWNYAYAACPPCF